MKVVHHSQGYTMLTAQIWTRRHSRVRPGKVHAAASWHDTYSLRYTTAARCLNTAHWRYIALKNEYFPLYSKNLSLSCHFSPSTDLSPSVNDSLFFNLCVSLTDNTLSPCSPGLVRLSPCLLLVICTPAGCRYKNLPIISSIIPLQIQPFCCYI